jgi:hypothetical protein
MSSEDPVESIASGITRGALEWTSDFINSLALKFRDKKLAFIQDSETIQIVKDQYNSGELNFYKVYIQDKDLLFIVKLGLTLRSLEKNDEKRQNLRNKVFKKYELKGLHVAQFVENGILNRYAAILLDNLKSVDDLKKKIEDTLRNIDKHILFVKWDDNERTVVEMARTNVFANSPHIFVISGVSSAAEIVRKCEETITKLLADYNLERISSGFKENLFYKRILRG